MARKAYGSQGRRTARGRGHAGSAATDAAYGNGRAEGSGLEAALSGVAAGTEGMVLDLQRMIRQPSVSARDEGLEECALLLGSMLEDAGLDSEVLHLKPGGRVGRASGTRAGPPPPPPPPPVVFAERRSESNPDKTLLFYNHYDVQPEEPVELWRYGPFDAVRRGNRVYGRGAIDDKGEIAARIRAVGSYIRETGDVPCNIKFVIEGEEEIGSGHLPRYLSRYRRKFACDGVIWEFGYVDPRGRPVVGLGMKGLMFVELTARGPARDAHSSLAVLIKNPAWRIVEALSTMRRADGRITIPGWYDDVRRLTARDVRLLEAEEFDEASFRREYGVDGFVGGLRGLGAKKALAGAATCNIAGISSGYSGSGAKTVLPAVAVAKLDFRLVPDMVPSRQFGLITRHLEANGFADVRARMLHGEAAARTDPSEQFVRNVRDAASASFGSEPVVCISNPAAGPMHAFQKALGAPCVSVGGTYVFSKIHSPNEFARVDLLKKTAACMCRIMDVFGRQS